MVNKPIFYFGIVEDRNDPAHLGRCKVRVVGMHTHDKNILPTDDLPWASTIQPATSGNVATNTVPAEGSQVAVIYADSDCQIPIVIGVVPSIPQQNNVLINTIPPNAKIATPLHPLGIDVPTDRIDQVNKNPTEISVADVDDSTAIEAINSANSLTTKQDSALATVGAATLSPRSVGVGAAGARLQQTYGQANPTAQTTIAVAGALVGSRSAALSSYISATQSNALGNAILAGKASIQDGIGLLTTAISDSVDDVGIDATGSAITETITKSTNYVANLASVLSSNQTIGGDIISGGLSVLQSIDSIAQSVGPDITAAVGKISGVLSGDSNQSISDAISGTIGSVQDALSNAASNALSISQSITIDNALSAVETFGETAWQYAPGPVKNVISGIANSLASYGVTWSAIKDGFNGATGKLALSTAALQSVDQLRTQLLSLLSKGKKPAEIIESIIGQIETYTAAVESVLSKAAKTSFLAGIDQSTIVNAVRSAVNNVKGVLQQLLEVVNDVTKSVTDFLTDAINDAFSTAISVTNVGVGIVNTILSMIPFSNIIVNVIASMCSSFIPGSDNDSTKQIGIAPAMSNKMLADGTYNSVAFKDAGAIGEIERQGITAITSTTFVNVGQGNTPPIYGVDGGPNSGATDPSDDSVPTFRSDANPSIASRTIASTVPSVDYNDFQIENQSQIESNLKTIISILPSYGLTTTEIQSAFCAIAFAYCRLIPKIEDFDYPSSDALKSRFPRAFKNSPSSIIADFINCQTRATKSADQFYSYVYSSSADGAIYGNTQQDDGATFAPAGLIPICGRAQYQQLARLLPEYSKQLSSASALIKSIEASTAVAATIFKVMIDGVATSNPSVIYEVVSRFPSVDRNVAINAYQHFYQAPVYDSANPNLNSAGDTVDTNTVAGSAHDGVVSRFGFQNFKYPLTPNRPSISKLATGDFTNTIVSYKEATRRVGFKYPVDGKTWDQPHSAYAAQYPYNDVKEYESGHVVEFDNTPGHERIHVWHRAGTFTEIDENGTTVNRVVGDNYQIVDRNGFISITGDATVNVAGNINIVCQSNASIDVAGNTSINTHGDFSIHAGRNVSICAGGGLHLWANQDASFQAKNNVNIMSTDQSLFITANDDLGLLAVTGDSYFSASKGSIFVSGNNAVDLYSEKGDCNVVANHSAYLTGKNGSVSIRAGLNAAISGTTDVDINAGANLRTQSVISMTHLCPGIYRETYGLVDSTVIGTVSQLIGGTRSVSVGATDGLTVGGSYTMSAGGQASIQAGGQVQIDAGMKLGIKAGASIGIMSVGKLGLDGSVLGLNSGLSVDSISAPSLPSIPTVTPASVSCMAPAGKGAPYSIPALIYGIPAISTKIVCRQPIERYHSESPYAVRPETDQELNSTDVKIVANALNAQRGIKSPLAVTKFDTIAQPTVVVDRNTNRYRQLIINADPKTFDNNSRLSDHFTLGNLIDGGVRGHNPLRRQNGLSINQIVANLSDLCHNIVEPMIEWLPGKFSGFNRQWRINSGYRALSNPASTSTSQHTKGMAVDIQIPSYTVKQLQTLLERITSTLDYDQCLLEYTNRGNMIIHISFDPTKNHQRHDKKTLDYRVANGYDVIDSNGFSFYSV